MNTARMPGNPRPYRPFPVWRDVYVQRPPTVRRPDPSKPLPVMLKNDTHINVLRTCMAETTVSPDACSLTPARRQPARWPIVILLAAGLLIAVLITEGM